LKKNLLKSKVSKQKHTRFNHENNKNRKNRKASFQTLDENNITLLPDNLSPLNSSQPEMISLDYLKENEKDIFDNLSDSCELNTPSFPIIQIHPISIDKSFSISFSFNEAIDQSTLHKSQTVEFSQDMFHKDDNLSNSSKFDSQIELPIIFINENQQEIDEKESTQKTISSSSTQVDSIFHESIPIQESCHNQLNHPPSLELSNSTLKENEPPKFLNFTCKSLASRIKIISNPQTDPLVEESSHPYASIPDFEISDEQFLDEDRFKIFENFDESHPKIDQRSPIGKKRCQKTIQDNLEESYHLVHLKLHKSRPSITSTIILDKSVFKKKKFK
jgi:hypothetical protein